jgi:hypothetical protein
VVIGAVGQSNFTSTTDLAIGSIRVHGSVEHANLLAGYSFDLGGTGPHGNNADAQIGLVSVGGDWIASNLVAGVSAGADGLFGTADDAKLSGAGVKDLGSTVSRIGQVIIGGQVRGTANAGDHFGIVAEAIGSMTVGGASVALSPQANSVVNLASNVTLREVA